MSHSEFSGHDTAAYLPPPSFGSPLPELAPPDAGDDDDASWFQPVSYDQTDYRDLDAYLALDPEAGRPAGPDRTGPGEPAFPDLTGDLIPGQVPGHGQSPVPDHDASAWASSRARAGAPAPAGRDAYADADPYAYPGDYADPDPYAYGGMASAEPGLVADESPGGRRPGPDGERPGRPPWFAPGPRRGPRWMLPAVVGLMAAAVGAGAVIVMTSGTSRPPSGLPMFSPGAHPASSAPALITPGAPGSASQARPAGTPARPRPGAPAALAAPITRARAQQVLSHYTTVNNTANGATSDSLIAGVETGSSLAIDRGIYRQERAAGSGGFPAFAPASARFYIPLEDPASYPHWFAVRVSNAPAAHPAVVTTREYLVFTQEQPGGPWLEAIEPFIRKDKAPPSIALDGNGFAKAVPLSSSGLLLSPAVASGATAAALNAGAGQPANPGNLAIDADQAALARRAPGASATARHSATTTRVFALRTSGGGALLFYDVAARLTLTAPAGATLKVTIPGYLSPGEGARQATLTYLEQFATYDPPRGSGSLLPVIADYSAITGRG